MFLDADFYGIFPSCAYLCFVCGLLEYSLLVIIYHASKPSSSPNHGEACQCLQGAPFEGQNVPH